MSSRSCRKENIVIIYNKILPVLVAMLGALLTYVALENSVGYVGWLWIIGLVVGPQLIVMSIRGSMK